jgi:hypothetical protein
MPGPEWIWVAVAIAVLVAVMVAMVAGVVWLVRLLGRLGRR